MSVGRNDPCPCGSGKKYKKCCLAKDEAAARQAYAQRAEAQREIVQSFAPLPPAELPPLPDAPPPSPLDQARSELWGEFESAEPAEQPALFRRALAERELLDAELAFEMICGIRDHHDRAIFAEALDALHELRPELYERDAPAYLDWRIGDALATGDLAPLPELTSALAATAGRDLDTFYMVLDKLAYHGQLALAAQMVAQAWPHIGQGQELVPWAQDEFARRAMDLTLFKHLEQNPNISPDDPELRADLGVFTAVDSEHLAAYLALLTGHDQRHWTLEDFAFQRRSRRGWDDDDEPQHDPAAQNLGDLTIAFLGHLYRQGESSLPKGDMARKSIARYILDRHAGKLEPNTFERATRPKGQKTPRAVRHAPPNQLCPDRATLDRFLAGMLNFISPQYYEAAATLELTPAWLRFLEAAKLLTPEQHAAALDDLRKLVADAAPIWQQRAADPAVGPNIRQAWGQP
jgi:hypothetical protein